MRARAQLASLLLSLVASGFMYLSQLLLGRFMSPADYGVYNAVSSLGVTLIACLQVVNLSAAKRVAELPEPSRELAGFVHRTALSVLLLSLSVAAAIALGLPLVLAWLGLDSAVPVLLYLAVFVLAAVAHFYRSVLQGLGEYVAFAGLSLVHAFAFFVLIAVFVGGLSGSYNAAFLATIAATFVALLITLRLLSRRGIQPLARGSGVGLPAVRDVIGVGAVTLLVTAFTNLDVPLARAWFSAADSGQFAGSAVIGRIAFYIPGILPSILFPEVARRQAAGRSSFRPLRSALLIATAASGFFVAAAFVFPELVLRYLLGSPYEPGAGILRYQALAMGAWALNSLLLHFFAAKGLRAGLAGSYGVSAAAFVAVLAARPAEPTALAAAWALASSAVLAFSLLYCAWVGRGARSG